MGFFLRLILTGLGWSFGGPLGAIIGYAIGGLFSSNRPRVIRSEVNETFGNTEEKRDFNVTLLVLSAAVMKADGNVKRSELDYVKRFFLQNFGQERAENYIKMLREILEKDYNLYEVEQRIATTNLAEPYRYNSVPEDVLISIACGDSSKILMRLNNMELEKTLGELE